MDACTRDVDDVKCSGMGGSYHTRAARTSRLHRTHPTTTNLSLRLLARGLRVFDDLTVREALDEVVDLRLVDPVVLLPPLPRMVRMLAGRAGRGGAQRRVAHIQTQKRKTNERSATRSSRPARPAAPNPTQSTQRPQARKERGNVN